MAILDPIGEGLYILRIDRDCESPLIFEVEVTKAGDDWLLTYTDGRTMLWSLNKNMLENDPQITFRKEV